MGAVPLRLNHALGSSLGAFAMRRLMPREWRVARINIDLCWPKLDAASRAQMLKESMRETGKAMSEPLRLWRLSIEKRRSLAVASPGRDTIDAICNAPGGAIILSPHLGSWEYLGLYIVSRKRMVVMYKPGKYSALDEFIVSGRKGGGLELDRRGVATMRKALADGAIVAILPDQEPKGGTGTFAPFFGIPAWTMNLVAALARREPAPVYACFAQRLARAEGYRLHADPVGDEIRSDDSVVSATALNAAVERCVRQCPAQYLWSYKRFRVRPDGSRWHYKVAPK